MAKYAGIRQQPRIEFFKRMNDLHRIFSTISPAEYAEVSVLARLVGENLISRLELVTLQPKVILDVGCGTGYCTTLLEQYYPEAKVIAIDDTLSMLQYMQNTENRVCAETLRLPLSNHSVDLIFANLLLPWCGDWSEIFKEWRRVLRPEGLLIFSCLGLDTLKELTENMLIIKDMHELGDALVHAKFSDPVMDMEYLTFTYREYKKLCDELRINGMIPANSDLQIEKNANDVFAITYEIIYGHTWGPNEMVDYTADEAGVVKIPLSFLRHRRGR